MLVSEGSSEVAARLCAGFKARGRRLEPTFWDEPLPDPCPADRRIGVLMDVTGAPDPAEDWAWDERTLDVLRRAMEGVVEVWAVTCGGTTAGGPERLGDASMWGVGRALSVEFPDRWGSAVNLDPTSTDGEEEIGRLVDEVHGSFEDQVPFHGGLRKVLRLTTLPDEDTPRLALRPDTAYLVTGGSGTLGRSMVRWLVSRGARHVALSSRSTVEEQRERTSGLADELAASGAVLHVVQADVAEATRMAVVLDGQHLDAPPIRGVLHLVGHLSEMRPLSDTRAEYLARRRPLDFLVLFSSASCTWGSALAVPYVAANYAMDALAHRASAEGLPFASVNWSWWTDTAIAAGVDEYFLRMGLGAVPEDKGRAALDAVIRSGTSGIVVAPVEWGSFRPVMAARRRRPLFDEVAAAAGMRERTWTRAEVAERTEASIRTILGTGGPIDAQRGFFDMGMTRL